MENERITTVGYPEFWPTVQDKFSKALKAIHNLIPLQREILSKPLAEPLHKLIRHITKMTVNSLGAVTTLTLNGYANDAMKIARGMFEATVTVCYLQKNTAEVHDFLDFHWVSQQRWVDYLRHTNPEMLKTHAAEIAQISEEFAKVEKKFRLKRGHRMSWCVKSIGERAKEVGMSDHYQTFYRWASSMQHVDIGGVTAQTEGNDADVAPSLEWVDIALVTGHSAAIHCLGTLNDVASLGMEAEIQKAMDEFQTAWAVRES